MLHRIISVAVKSFSRLRDQRSKLAHLRETETLKTLKKLEMPLIVITGYPSSGKSKTCQALKEFLEKEKQKVVHVISENEYIDEEKNEILSDSRQEKTVRGTLKSEAVRQLHKEEVVILDGLNYIKGFRYELYCASKAAKTTQVTIHCDISPEDAWSWNQARSQGSKYSKDVFDGLIQRYETPIGTNRWDSPLFLSLKELPLDLEAVFQALFHRKAPPPNQSTQCQPLSSTSFLHELDMVTKDIVTAIMEAQRSGLGIGVDITVPRTSEKVFLEQSVTMSELTKTRRQFITYAKARAIEDMDKLASMWVQYLNKSLNGVETTDID